MRLTSALARRGALSGGDSSNSTAATVSVINVQNNTRKPKRRERVSGCFTARPHLAWRRVPDRESEHHRKSKRRYRRRMETDRVQAEVRGTARSPLRRASNHRTTEWLRNNASAIASSPDTSIQAV